MKRRLIGFLNACRIQGREDLTISVDGGSVTLRGWFHSARERQLCVENCRRMTGVVQVIDETKLALADSLGSADSRSAYRRWPR